MVEITYCGKNIIFYPNLSVDVIRIRDSEAEIFDHGKNKIKICNFKLERREVKLYIKCILCHSISRRLHHFIILLVTVEYFFKCNKMSILNRSNNSEHLGN